MTRVLIVAWYFPPRGGAGTQRFAKFCKYLPGLGVEPVVLTAGDAASSPHAPHDDPSLVGEAPPEIVRVDAPARARLSRRLRRALRFCLDEDEWADAAEARALQLARERPFDAVVTTVSPFACYRVGARLRRELGVPWLLDLRDPWALDGWRRYRTRLHAAHDLAHMRRALAAADVVIANVPEAAKAYAGLGADPARTMVIPNGFDEEDFAAAAPPAWAGDGRFHLVHNGTFHAVDAPEGLTRNGAALVRHRQIAPLGRTGHYLLHALAALRQRAPDAASRLCVHLYGSVDRSHRELIARLGLGDLIELHGYVPHRESVAALLGADAVFVPLHGVPPGERALVVPGKLYEALASGRPVLAALPAGDGGDLVTRLGAGVVVPPTDAGALAAALGDLLAAAARGAPRGGAAAGQLLPFARRSLTRLLAQAITAAVARRPVADIRDPWREIEAPAGRVPGQESP